MIKVTNKAKQSVGVSSQPLARGMQGPKGDPGKDGKDGYTPVKCVDYFDGEPGKDGADGADGRTPVKGVDYFTEEDIAEMVSAVIAELPVYNGEVAE